jgi:hypothetical protein
MRNPVGDNPPSSRRILTASLFGWPRQMRALMPLAAIVASRSAECGTASRRQNAAYIGHDIDVLSRRVE